MNKKLFILIAAVLFVPAVIITVLLLNLASDELDEKSVAKVILQADEEEIYEYTDSEMIGFFTRVINESPKISSSVKDIETYEKIPLSFETIKKTVEYSLYLSPSPDDCLLSDEQGKLYRIPSGLALQLLKMDEVKSVYWYATPPDAYLLVGDGEFYRECNYANWFYRRADGELFDYSKEMQKAEESDRYPVALNETVDFRFESDPDWCYVELYNGDSIVYDDSLDNLSGFQFTRDAVIRAVITAEWYDGEKVLYYGKAKYEFYLAYDAPASYDISASEAFPGGLVYIRLYNIADETLRVETEIDTTQSPNVVQYAGSYVLLFPISVYNEAGDYTIRLLSEKSSFEIPFRIKPKVFESYRTDFTGTSLQGKDYLQAEQNFFTSMAPYDAMYEKEQLWVNEFIAPLDQYNEEQKEVYWISQPRFGETQYINGQRSPLRNYGIHYICPVGTEVKASNKGVVLFAGETEFLGKTVILDHGLGLKTVYGHLEDIYVTQRMTVEKGWRIGKTGDTGYTTKPSLYFAFSVGGVYLNPYNFIGENVEFINIYELK